LILFYAIGYRYDFLKKEVVKVGVLYIDSSPKNAKIYLNGRDTDKETPSRIFGLLPNEYKLEIRREGYFTYQKKISVYPEIATNLRNIILFKNTYSLNEIVSENIKQIQLSSSGQKAAYLIESNDSEGLFIYDFNSEDKKLIFEDKLSNPVNNFILSPYSDCIFVKQKNKQLIINVNNDEKINLDKYKLNINDIKWDSDNEKIIYTLINGAIYQINLIEDKVMLIVNKNIVDLTIKNRMIFYIDKQNDALKFNYYDLNRNLSNEILDLRQSDKFDILSDSYKFIVLIDRKNEDVYLVDTSTSPITYEKLNIQAKSSQFTADHKKLLYYNDYEIGYFDFEKGENNLITRTSNQIQKAIWHPLEQNIIYLEGNKLKITELSGPVRNTFDLYQSNIIDFIIDINGKNVYLYDKISENNILSKLNIR